MESLSGTPCAHILQCLPWLCKRINDSNVARSRNASKLADNISDLEQQLAAVKKKNAALEKENATCADTISGLEATVADLQKQLEASKKKCAALEKENENFSGGSAVVKWSCS